MTTQEKLDRARERYESAKARFEAAGGRVGVPVSDPRRSTARQAQRAAANVDRTVDLAKEVMAAGHAVKSLEHKLRAEWRDAQIRANATCDTRAQLEAEAAELYPIAPGPVITAFKELQQDRRRVYVRAKTVSAEQVEAAAGMFLWDIEEHPEPKPTWEMLTEEQRGIWRSGARAAFRSAGFHVEEP